MNEWKLHAAGSKHGLERLLDSLLGVKADEHIRHFVDRQHRPGPGRVCVSATKKLLSKILLAGH
jgi:hypothetical protein